MAFVFLFSILFLPFSFCFRFFSSPCAPYALPFCELIPLFEVKNTTFLLIWLKTAWCRIDVKVRMWQKPTGSPRWSGDTGFEDSGFGQMEWMEHMVVNRKLPWTIGKVHGLLSLAEGFIRKFRCLSGNWSKQRILEQKAAASAFGVIQMFGTLWGVHENLSPAKTNVHKRHCDQVLRGANCTCGISWWFIFSQRR